MKRNNKKRRIYLVLKVVNFRGCINFIFRSQSVRAKYLGIFWGLYISGSITFSSYLRLETLINKIEDKKLISLRKIL